MPCFKIPSLFIASFLLNSLSAADDSDPWASFDTSIKACKTVDRIYDKLPSNGQNSLLNFCNSFVGYSTTTVTGQTDVWVTASIPLKTVTVTSNPRLRYARAEETLHERSELPTGRNIFAPTPLTTSPPIPTITNPPIPIHLHAELKRAKKLTTPPAFKTWASLAIRTGCACLGFSTQVTFPVFTTTTATSTVPISCAQAPFSAYHIASYLPASAAAVAYEYGWQYYFEASPYVDPIEQCCRDCQGRPGCVQFVYEKLDPEVEFAVARCNMLYFDDYDGQSVTGIPRLAGETNCPNGYLAVKGLAKDTSSTTVSEATFLGPCAVTTVRR